MVLDVDLCYSNLVVNMQIRQYWFWAEHRHVHLERKYAYELFASFDFQPLEVVVAYRWLKPAFQCNK